MELRIRAGDLKERLEFAESFVGGARSIVEITKAIKLHASSKYKSLVLEASDFSKACRTRVSDVEVQKDGVCAVSSEQLGRIIRAHASDDVLTLKAGRFLTIDNGKRFVSKIGTMNPDEFPQIPVTPEGATSIEVQKEYFLSIVDRLKFATSPSNQETPFSSTIFFGEGTALATDRFKIAFFEDPGISWAGLRFPVGGEKLFRHLDDTIQITPGNDHFFVHDDHHFFFLQSPVCDPPMVQKVFAAFQSPLVTLELTKESVRELLRAVQRASIATSNITLFFTPERIYVGGIGDANEIVDAVHVTPQMTGPDEVVFTYQASFLQGCLGGLDKGYLSVYRQGALKVESGGYSGLIQHRINGHEDRVIKIAREVA